MSGRIAWVLRLRPCLAEPPAESPSTMNSSRQRRILLLAVGELARQAGDVERALAAGQVARLARGLAGAGGVDDLAGDRARLVRVFLQELLQACAPNVLSTTGRTSDETSFSLVCEEKLGSGTFTDSTAIMPSRMSSPDSVILACLAMPFCSM